MLKYYIRKLIISIIFVTLFIWKSRVNSLKKFQKQITIRIIKTEMRLVTSVTATHHRTVCLLMLIFYFLERRRLCSCPKLCHLNERGHCNTDFYSEPPVRRQAGSRVN